MAKARQQPANQSEQLVQFRRADAQRIANVVGWYESAPRGRKPSSLPRASAGGGEVFRICTFAGEWGIGQAKTVTFKYQAETPNTVVATNLFWPIPDGAERDCAIARDGTAWHLLVPRLHLAEAATAAVITTTEVEFKTLPVLALATASTAKFSLAITSCATATASP